MWDIIINLIYEQSCESYLAEAQSACRIRAEAHHA